MRSWGSSVLPVQCCFLKNFMIRLENCCVTCTCRCEAKETGNKAAKIPEWVTHRYLCFFSFYISQSLRIITVVPLWLVVRYTMASIPPSNVSLLLTTMCNVQVVGTYGGMLDSLLGEYFCRFGVTAQAIPKNILKTTVATHSFLCPCRSSATNGRSPDVFSV